MDPDGSLQPVHITKISPMRWLKGPMPVVLNLTLDSNDPCCI
jgi:hypothetical protein